MKKLRKLRLNDVQQLKTSELEMINAGRASMIISDNCHCSYSGDYHMRTCVSANLDLYTLKEAWDSFKNAPMYSKYMPYIAGAVSLLIAADPSIDTFKMTFTGKCYDGYMVHYSKFVSSKKLF